MTSKQAMDGSEVQKRIRHSSVSELCISGELETVAPFKENLLKEIRKMDLSLDQIYNADDSGLF